MLKFGTYLKKLNCTVPTAPLFQVENTFERLYFDLNFLK